jgi:hypothetical protein
MKAARDAALTNFYDNDKNVDELTFQEKIDKFNRNPNQAYTQLTPSMLRTFNTEYRKRKQTEPANNPRSNPKEKTKKKRKK